MEKGKLSYTVGLITGALFVIGVYTISMAAFVYFLLSDNKWLAFLPVMTMLSFSTWRKMQSVYMYLDVIARSNAALGNEYSNLMKIVSTSKKFGSIN